MTLITEIKLYDADTLEYAGSMKVNKGEWHYEGVTDEFLVQMTTGLPLKGALSSLITFNMVYDVIETEVEHI